MFSDAMISLKVLGAVIILLLLGAYSHQHGKIEDQKGLKIIRACVISMTTCLDEPLVIRIRTKGWSATLATAEVKVGRSYLTEHPIKVKGLRGAKSTGRVIDVLGHFDPRQTFIVTRQREDDWIQTTKYIVSLVGLGLCLWLFAHLYTLSPGKRLQLIPRQGRKHDA